MYVSCAGNFGANDGTVGILDYNIQARPTAPFLYRNAYQEQNGIKIGDAQDLIVFGDKVVVACTTSSKIEVLNRVGKVEQTIKLHNVEHVTWLQMVSMFTSLPTAAKYIR